MELGQGPFLRALASEHAFLLCCRGPQPLPLWQTREGVARERPQCGGPETSQASRHALARGDAESVGPRELANTCVVRQGETMISFASTLQCHMMVATISHLLSTCTHAEPSRVHASKLCTTELSENRYGTILELSWNYPGTTSELRRNRPFILCFHGFLSGQFLLPVPLIKILLKAQGVGTTSRERARTGAS